MSGSDPVSDRFPGAILRPYGDLFPKIDPSAWIAPGVSVVGDVEIGPGSSVFYGSVLRGDVHHIRVGARTNLQDQSTVHVTADRFPTILEDEITVGHRAVVHGCRVGEGALIGIGAIVLDGAVVGEEALVAAGAVVRPGQVVPPATLWAGVPAKEIRRLTEDEIRLQRERTLTYVTTAAVHAASGGNPTGAR